jgi:large-conductance mechanosensitive channel
MYCPACANPITPGLSFCNRCGMNLKDRNESKGVTPVAAFLTAITLIGVIGLGIMLGGAMALTNEAKLGEPVVVLFMIMTFLIVAMTEFMLVRQLSRLVDKKDAHQLHSEQRPTMMPNEIRHAEPRALHEPVSSVTENTTRTLKYSEKEPLPR